MLPGILPRRLRCKWHVLGLCKWAEKVCDFFFCRRGTIPLSPGAHLFTCSALACLFRNPDGSCTTTCSPAAPVESGFQWLQGCGGSFQLEKAAKECVTSCAVGLPLEGGSCNVRCSDGSEPVNNECVNAAGKFKCMGIFSPFFCLKNVRNSIE